MQWQELATTSHYQTAVAVKREMAKGDFGEAATGIEELIEALSRSDKRALRSQLIRLMAHVIKWKAQPARRTRSWSLTIRNARHEITDIREETPSLTREVILEMWNRCFERAREDAEDEMGARCGIRELTWQEVFDEPYSLL